MTSYLSRRNRSRISSWRIDNGVGTRYLPTNAKNPYTVSQTRMRGIGKKPNDLIGQERAQRSISQTEILTKMWPNTEGDKITVFDNYSLSNGVMR